ncbi:unnamed protein product [Amoebophrya sp. A120]|nr:unnamed protein product [Amoebophrya sp. A120]|eukprot:GSA120T00011878001.1
MITSVDQILSGRVAGVASSATTTIAGGKRTSTSTMLNNKPSAVETKKAEMLRSFKNARLVYESALPVKDLASKICEMELVGPENCQSEDRQQMDDEEDVEEEAEALEDVDSNVGRRTSCSADVETADSEEESDSDDNCSTDSVEAEDEEGRVLQDGPRHGSPARRSAAATPLTVTLNLLTGPQKRASAKAKSIEFRSDKMSPQWMFFLDSENKQGFLTIRGTVYFDDWNTNFNSSGDRTSPVYAEYKHFMPAAKSALSMGANPEQEELGPFLILHKGFYDRAATAIMELEVALLAQSKIVVQQEQRVVVQEMKKDEGGRDGDDEAGTSEHAQTVETETAPVKVIRDATTTCDQADEELLAFEKQAGTESHKRDVFRNFAEGKSYLEKRQTKLPTCFVEYLKKNIATKISDKLFLQGHSLGGAAALVIHRLREKSDLLQAMTNNSAGKKIHTNAFSAPPMFTSGSPEQAKLAFVYLATGKLANWALNVNRVFAGNYRCSWLQELATEFPHDNLNKQETRLWKNSTNLFFNFDPVPRLAFMNVQKDQIVLPPVEKVFWLRDTAPAGLQEKLDKCGKSCSRTLTRVATVFRVPLYAQATVLSSLDQMLSPYPKEFLLDAVEEHKANTYEPLLVALLGGKNSKKDSPISSGEASLELGMKGEQENSVPTSETQNVQELQLEQPRGEENVENLLANSKRNGTSGNKKKFLDEVKELTAEVDDDVDDVDEDKNSEEEEQDPVASMPLPPIVTPADYMERAHWNLSIHTSK